MTYPYQLNWSSRRALVAGGCALFALACSEQGGAIRVTEAVYRPPLGGGAMGVAYLTIESRTADRIVGVSSPAARAVEIHATVIEGAMATMKPAGEVDLPAGTPVSLSAGGRHLMVIDPQGVESAETFPVIIQLESGRTITVECAVDRAAG